MSAAVTLGERLKAAREAKGLSAQKAADKLHLDGWVVEALERGDYLPVGPPVYVKGHLKRYADLLGLPLAEILEAYAASAPAAVPAATPPPPAPPIEAAPAAGRPPVRGSIAALAALGLLAAGLYGWQSRPRSDAEPPPSAALEPDTASAPVPADDEEVPPGALPPAVPATTPASRHSMPASAAASRPAALATAASPAALPAIASASPSGVPASAAASRPAASATAALPPAAPAIAAASPSAVPANAAASHPAALPTAAFPPSAPATAAAAASTAGAGRARLRLSFSADSWVEVHDAAGKSLYAGKGRANSVKTIAGQAPMKVYLGFANGVQVQLNNHVVAIGPQFVTGDAAHFEAGADGVLRRDAHDATAGNAHPHG